MALAGSSGFAGGSGRGTGFSSVSDNHGMADSGAVSASGVSARPACALSISRIAADSGLIAIQIDGNTHFLLHRAEIAQIGEPHQAERGQ